MISMKRKTTVTSVLLIIFLICATFSFFSKAKAEEIIRADGYTISRYKVILDVKEDNKIDVTENIVINFTNPYKHGIYKFTPTWLEYTGKDGKTIKRNSKVINYRAEGDPYTLDTVKKKARIKIGSASEYVGEGEKTYIIKYTYDMGKDPYKGFDEFIFHAFGDYWGTKINNAEVEVNMPKSIENYKVNFFTDKYRKENVTRFVDYKVRGNQLKAKFNQYKYSGIEKHCEQYDYLNAACQAYSSNPKGLEKSLTVDIELPEGYFTGGSWNYGYASMIISFIVFILTGSTIYKWQKYGKDYDKKAETVEFYPPEDLNSAEIGYIFNNKQANKKLTVSLIVSLASKGYIKIDEIKDKKKKIQITNLIPKALKKPVLTEDFKRKINIRKLKDIDDKLETDEETMMKFCFKNSNTKQLVTNIDKFLEVKDSLIKGGYIEIIEDNEKEIIKEYEKKLEEYKKSNQNYSKKIETVPVLSKMEQIVYDTLFNTEDVVILSEHETFYLVFEQIRNELENNLKDKIHDKKASKQIGRTIIITILVLILSVISYGYVEDLDPRISILYTLSFVCILINAFFIFIMARKTEYGEAISARVKGFRHFLETAEKPKLEALVAENPQYFYNILPYTYVLNISKKWIKKFEDIKMPEIDMGNFDYGSDSSYSSLYDDVSFPVSSSSGGCSSCGGGCSSCGGGCSSCGGGGSW